MIFFAGDQLGPKNPFFAPFLKLSTFAAKHLTHVQLHKFCFANVEESICETLKKELKNFKYLVLAGDQKCKVVKNGAKKVPDVLWKWLIPHFKRATIDITKIIISSQIKLSRWPFWH